jgi:mannose-6-phosphate isomerase-like protein (cupin superfamily)
MIRAAAAFGVAACAGCPGPATNGGGTGPVATIDASPADATPVSEDEKLAMVAQAMTLLAPPASQCWAAGAVDDYLLKGTVTLQIRPTGGAARVTVAHDTTDDKVLTACLVAIAEAYRWPPALTGEIYELPFAFDAPAGQFTIDRRLVPVKEQAGVGVAVLIDEKNSNNPAATVLEVTLAAGARTSPAIVDRHEVWYVTAGGGAFALPADRATRVPARDPELAAGDIVDIPAGGYRNVRAGDAGLSAVIFVVPGGIEGVARGGALPGATVTAAPDAKVAKPARHVKRGDARAYVADKRVVDIYLDSRPKDAAKDVALSVLALDATAAVPEHVHADETEVLYVLAGAADMVVDGVKLPVGEHTVVQIPKGTKHQATVTAALRAVQVYTPGGPEQRFKPGPPP